MIKRKFYGTKRNGRFILNDKTLYETYLANFEEGQDLEMTLAKRFKRRTSGQPDEETNFNGYWWAVVVRIVSDEMGEIDDNVTHNLLQMLFNKKGLTIIDPNTKKRTHVEVPRGTSNLSGAEFAEMCSKVRIWAAIPGNLSEMGVYIPEPHEIVFGDET